ncbi:Activin_recp domain-containing protein [Caenorhabditis elegans]|uniref:Activin_recp domain-containing protein n=1 Tax=Caenorhabditis elegans TaxID=6239 RepID=Q9XVE8_CAEEL|nr:Activin_recp domain-containing protein [Caenorhabditis elegans]CAB03836.1 Activin_recp domain-containing protein [Caenorhabditis elegans]|eukprot:NP_492577.1 Uncharacterized protein CELE_C04F12.5 [Caenorhabditis elegans]
MRFLHPPVILLLLVPVSMAIIQCTHYRVPQGQPIPKAERNPRCHSKAEYCVKVTGSSVGTNLPFISGRCEHAGECKDHGNDCFTRTDTQGKEEEICCSSGNFSNHGSTTPLFTSIALFITLLIMFC